MKTLFTLIIIAMCAALPAAAQEAVNFQCNDCGGTPRNFYADLEQGKAVILCWVMPCGTCVGPAMTCYNIAKSYQPKSSARVAFYLIDDYADTDCLSLSSWAAEFKMPAAPFMTQFSCSSIKMRDYGSTGMPKVMVVGPNKKIYYHANNTIDVQALTAAVETAAAATSAEERPESGFAVIPNPASGSISVRYGAAVAGALLEVVDRLGRVVTWETLTAAAGETVRLAADNLPNGIYALRLHTPAGVQSAAAVVVR